MRFRGYQLKYNPSYLKISGAIDVVKYRLPFGKIYMKNKAKQPYIIQGKGVIFEEDYIQEFNKLKAIFEENISGKLVLPTGQTLDAYFKDLQIIGKGGQNLLEYSFEFIEKVS